MATKPLPSQEVLRQLLDYNPTTGALTWRRRAISFFTSSETRSAAHVAALWNARYAGTPALASLNTGGHRAGIILGKARLSHRVIWKMHYGFDPDVIDHENGDRCDNRLINLRNTGDSGNARNTKLRRNNKSGATGVEYVHKGRKTPFWIAKICNKQIGIFGTFDEAVSARKKAEQDMGFHENHGRVV